MVAGSEAYLGAKPPACDINVRGIFDVGMIVDRTRREARLVLRSVGCVSWATSPCEEGGRWGPDATGPHQPGFIWLHLGETDVLV